MVLNRAGGEWSAGTDDAVNATVVQNGNLVSFSIKAVAGGGSQLFGQIYTSTGSPVGTSFLLKSVTEGEIARVTATPLADGRFAVAWVHITDEFTTRGLETGIFNSNGSVFKAPVQVGPLSATLPKL
jgi:hypothetical protein